MHMQGEPRTMQQDPHYEDVVSRGEAFLAQRVEAAKRAGIARERIVIDPGFGFGKKTGHNLELLRGLPRIAGLGSRCWSDFRASRYSAESPAKRWRTGFPQASPPRCSRPSAAPHGSRARRGGDARCAAGAQRNRKIDSPCQRLESTSAPTACAGRVGELPITPDFVMRLGYAAGKVLAAERELPQASTPAVLIGKDTRISGYMLESALQAGLSAAGVDIYLSGPMPTPAVAYLTRALRLQAGIVISASHNPFEDNGIKFFSADGNKLPDAIEHAIEARLDAPLETMPSAQLGKARRIDDAAGRYIEFCKSTFPNDLDLRGIKLVVDCAHGATYHVAPHVFHELGADVTAIGNHPDGLNINRECGATHPEALAAAVEANRADLGIALDGDGDRLVMADHEGRLYDGDQLLYVIARLRHKRGTLKGGVVGTLMTNLGMEQALAALGIPFARAAVGDRYVLELLIENRLAARRRELRPHHLPRQAHDRRRHHLRAAGAARAARRGQAAGRPVRRLAHVPAGPGEREGAQGFRLAGK